MSTATHIRAKGSLIIACVFASISLALAAVCLWPSFAFAYEGLTLTETPGLVDTSDGMVSFADALLSDKAETVQGSHMKVGDQLALVGDFSGGWGTVTFQWASSDGDGVLRLLEEGIAADASLLWEPISTTQLPGVLPQLNSAVRSGGKSQTMVIAALSVGNSAWRLTASDEVGNEHSIYWVVQVDPADIPSTSIVPESDDPAAPAPAANQEQPPTAANGKAYEGDATANVNNSVTVNIEQPRPRSAVEAAAFDPSAPIRNKLPKTADRADWAFLLLGAAASCAAAAAVCALVQVRRASRKKQAE